MGVSCLPWFDAVEGRAFGHDIVMELHHVISLAAVLVLAASVTYTGQLGFLNRNPRSAALSAASGFAVGYVFLGLLTKLAAGDEKVAKEAHGAFKLLEDHIYFVALIGMIVYYGLVIAAKRSRRHRREDGKEDRAAQPIFWLALGLYSLYVFLLGDLVEDTAEKDVVSMLVLTAALAFHFVGSDFGLREDHKDRYVARGRWVLGAATLAGWAVGVLLEASDIVVATVAAFLVGAILVNALNDELPDEHDAHFLPFAGGALVSGLLLATIG